MDKNKTMDELKAQLLANNPEMVPLLQKLIITELLVENHEQLLSKVGQITTDLILRITALERVLVSKGIFTEKEYEDVLGGAAKQMSDLMKQVLDKDKDNNEKTKEEAN